MLGDEKLPQQEAEGADLQFCNLVIAPVDGESQVGVENLGKIEIFGGYERLTS